VINNPSKEDSVKNKTMVFGLLAGSLIMSPVFAQPDTAHMAKCQDKMMTDLKLNADQKEKIKGLHKQHRESMKPFHEKMKAIRDQVKAELLKPQPSKQALDGFAANLGELHKQMALMRNDHLLQFKAILTPEQFSKLVNRDCMGGKGMKGCCPGMGMMNDSCKFHKGTGKGMEKHGGMPSGCPGMGMHEERDGM
jgi:Spy/CpxP family protein refolding chaperone